MIELLVIALGFVVLRRRLMALEVLPSGGGLTPKRSQARLQQMAEYADRLFTEKKWLAAEKAYLGVLKLDHKNVTAYSHLGIIYSTQKSMADAIECFQIAVRLKPSGATLQNLALAFYDNRNYMKSVAAFEKAIMMEPTAQRYMGLSKAQHKLQNDDASIIALEKAIQLEPSKRILQILADAYKDAERGTEAAATLKRLSELDRAA
jgi:tetratricopeptide (TPR) repeat protein